MNRCFTLTNFLIGQTGFEKVLIALLLMAFAGQCRSQEPADVKDTNPEHSVPHRKGRLLYKDDFKAGLDNWVIETPPSPNSEVITKNGRLVIDVDGGATVWYNKVLSGNIMITYRRKVVMQKGRNDRLSDFNQFWMATDPNNKNLFTRSGVFDEYDSLLLYYAGFGGNSNTTTRFRKYDGTGERVLYNDLTDPAHLLKPNQYYFIRTVVYNGVTKFFVDEEEFFSFRDPAPIREGYFGFRTTQSRHEIDNFRIYQLK